MICLLDGVPDTSFGLRLQSRPDIPSPSREFKTYKVDGRDGDLTQEGDYKDMSFNLLFSLIHYGETGKQENAKARIREAKKFFLDKKIMRFSDDDVFYKIKRLEVANIGNELEQFGSFSVKATVGPFEYALAEPLTIYKATSVFNYGSRFSQPRFTIYANGEVRLRVNHDTLLIKDIKGYIEIDSEAFTTTKGNENMSDKKMGGFPVFEVGNNDISWEGNVEKIEIDTRWRYI